jgi:glucose/arabinose dehydrogenase/photosystem II stability/assembly factor-like uncharacterized protein
MYFQLSGIQLASVAAFLLVIASRFASIPAVHAQVEAQTNLYQFDLMTPSSGWVLIGNSHFWTSDAGQTWDEIGPLISTDAKVQDIEFLDPDQGWILWTTVYQDGTANFTLAHTIDHGTNWNTRDLVLFEPGEIAAQFERAAMGWFDASTGWVAVKQATGSNFSLGTLFTTSDGGLTWIRSNLPVADKVTFTEPQIGWAVGGPAGNQIFQTQDGGATWRDVRPDIPSDSSATMYEPFYVDGQGILITTQLGAENSLDIYTMEGSDDTWLPFNQVPLDVEPGLVGLSILDARDFVAVIPGTSLIIRMQDGILDLIENQDGFSRPISELDMVSLEVGWGRSIDSECVTAFSPDDATASVSCTSITRLLQTSDGGLHWTELQLPFIEAGIIRQSTSEDTSLATQSSESTVFTYPNFGSTEMFIGQGFDKCEIPTLSQLQTWWNGSPYKVVNLYIGGSSRTCANSALTASYVQQLHQQGWKFIPTWVGPQAPCTFYPNRMSSDPTTAYNQGVNEANLAVERLAVLGLTYPNKTGSVVYYDIEYYGTDISCRQAVNAFMNGWVSQIRARGNLAGVYGSTLCDTGLSDFRTIANVPDAIWPARWYHNIGEGYYDPNASVWNLGSCLPNTVWANHQRIRQYEGDHDETWGSLTLGIDSNVLDGVVAVPPALEPARVSFQEVVGGLSSPVFITHAGDGSGRLFILERSGRIRIIKNGSLLPTPFLDIQSTVKSASSEQGLLGLAFHPSYESNGRFYVAYTAFRPGDSNGSILTLRQYSASTGDPDLANPASGATILEIDHPTYSNHNGGTIIFGDDGYLYWSTGDGGGGGDPDENGQDLTSLLGKILRLDVDSASPYAVPASNPFYSNPNPNTKLIWAYGLRNPWRMSFDRLTHDLYIGDVGQGAREEIDFQPASSTGGENYGWDVMEGSLCYEPSSGCDQTGKVLPVAEYDHSLGCSVSGGYVYRGSEFPSLTGFYLYGDFCSGRIWAISNLPSGWSTPLQLADTAFNITTFGEDESGESYLADYATGKIYKVQYLDPSYTISGNAGTSGVILNYTDGTAKATTSQADGNYSFSVPYNWSGTVTPTHPCYTFTPSNRTYNNVTANQTNQNYTAAFNPASGCANITVTIGANLIGSYGLLPGQEKREFYDASGGPVVVESTNGFDIIAAIRLQSMQSGTLLDYNESMGIPEGSLSTKYIFPVYENKWAPLNSQLRFAHLGTGTKTIKVTIGTETWTYDVAEGQDKRIFLDRSGGPVIVESEDGVTKIVAAIRLQAMSNNVLHAYSETFGIPIEDLSTRYYFPVYENLWAPLNSQLRFAHLGAGTKTIKVTIGTETWTYDVAEGEDKRIFLARSGGPVIIESLDGVTKVIAAIRLQSMKSGTLLDYNETMGIPAGSLSTKYIFPVYENLWAPLNSQLRFAHLGAGTKTIKVTIGTETWTYDVAEGEDKRIFLARSGGPVIVESLDGVTQIVAAIRLQCMKDGLLNCYSETMGIPFEFLSDTYYFPVYENLWTPLNSQVRFGAP